MDENGWEEWRKYVLNELKRMSACYETLNEKMTKVMVDVGMLKVKAGVWGGLAGLISALVVVAYLFLNNKK